MKKLTLEEKRYISIQVKKGKILQETEDYILYNEIICYENVYFYQIKTRKKDVKMIIARDGLYFFNSYKKCKFYGSKEDEEEYYSNVKRNYEIYKTIPIEIRKSKYES